eukprot:3789600-Amphidinium_carterae.1
MMMSIVLRQKHAQRQPQAARFSLSRPSRVETQQPCPSLLPGCLKHSKSFLNVAKDKGQRVPPPANNEGGGGSICNSPENGRRPIQRRRDEIHWRFKCLIGQFNHDAKPCKVHSPACKNYRINSQVSTQIL